MQGPVRRGDADEAVRVAAPCHPLPNADSRSGRPANTRGQSSRSRIEAGSEFIGERLIVNKAVGAGRADSLFVEALGIELPAFDPRNLGADPRSAVREIVRAIRRPELELLVMRSESV